MDVRYRWEPPSTIGDGRGPSCHTHLLPSWSILRVALSLGCFFGVGGTKGRKEDRLEGTTERGASGCPQQSSGCSDLSSNSAQCLKG